MAYVDIERPGPGAVTFRVHGSLGAEEATLLQRTVRGEAGLTLLRLDLDSVDYLDSAGLGALVGGVRLAREERAAVTVRCTRPTFRRLLTTSGLDPLAGVALEPPDDEGPAGVREPARPGPGDLDGSAMLDPSRPDLE